MEIKTEWPRIAREDMGSNSRVYHLIFFLLFLFKEEVSWCALWGRTNIVCISWFASFVFHFRFVLLVKCFGLTFRQPPGMSFLPIILVCHLIYYVVVVLANQNGLPFDDKFWCTLLVYCHLLKQFLTFCQRLPHFVTFCHILLDITFCHFLSLLSHFIKSDQSIQSDQNYKSVQMVQSDQCD